jgi:hypothetical protein
VFQEVHQEQIIVSDKSVTIILSAGGVTENFLFLGEQCCFKTMVDRLTTCWLNIVSLPYCSAGWR